MLQYNAAVAQMRFIGNLGYRGQLESLGISREDYVQFVGDAPWVGSMRNRMTTVLHSLMMGTLDALSLPRFKVPAELCAACISVFVGPVNVFAACTFAPSTGEADLMARGQSSIVVSPEQLYALCVLLYDSPVRTDARGMFERAVGIELKKVEGASPEESINVTRKGGK